MEQTETTIDPPESNVTPLVRLLKTSVSELSDDALAAHVSDMRALRQSAPTRRAAVQGEGKAPAATKVQQTISKFF
jgi:hypothetical protein